MTSGSDDFFLTLNVWSFKSRHVELGTFEIPVVGGVLGIPRVYMNNLLFIYFDVPVKAMSKEIREDLLHKLSSFS